MTNKRAIEIIQIAMAEVEWDYPMYYTVAFEKAIEALQKMEPKKPTHTYKRLGIVVEGCCAVCEESVLPEWDYCPNCSQALDWSEEDDE